MGLEKCILLIFLVWIDRASLSWGLGDLQHTTASGNHQKLCGFTRYPQHCVETLSELGLDPQNGDVVSILVEKLRNETVKLIPDSSNPSYMLSRLWNKQAHGSTIGYCTELMNMSLRRLDLSLSALKDSPRKRKQDIQTWLSAVMTYQSNCKDALNDKLDDFQVRKMEHISHMASNTLALVNRISGDPANSTISKDFPNWVKTKTRKLLQGTGVRANAVVAKDGSGNYRTVSEAIKAASGGRFVIYVKAGFYKEKIRIDKDGITLIGAGKYSTIIGYGDSASGGFSMPDSSSLTLRGDGFIARDIGFQNTAGPNGGQAVAMDIASDRSVLYRCSISGYQDTLLARSLRQFYKECDVYGTIDFIFGNAAAVFQNCNILLRRPKQGGGNAILASAREDPGQNTGFSLQKCTINAASDLVSYRHSVESYLGRPWKKYARSVIIQSYIGDAIRPKGWLEWNNYEASLYYGEYANTGPSASTSNRVRWPGYHIMGSSEAVKFTVERLIGGNSWLPSTEIPFSPRLS